MGPEPKRKHSGATPHQRHPRLAEGSYEGSNVSDNTAVDARANTNTNARAEVRFDNRVNTRAKLLSEASSKMIKMDF